MTTLETAQRWLADAERVAVLTGAGISKESGLPTFRGAEGLWRRRRPEQLATPEAFARDPKTVWEWYDWRRSVVAKAEPNPGHHALVALEKRAPDFTLITQNVDGLHDRAGSQRLLKLHGDIWTVRCTGCGAESTNRDVPLAEIPPRCGCGSLLRPGVVQPAASLPLLAREAGARIIEVNPEETPLTAAAHASFRSSSAEFLPQLAGGVVRV